MGKQLDQAKKDCQVYLDNYEISKGIILRGKLNDISTRKVFLANDAIITLVSANGKLGVRVEGME
jgi:hypothetical protein